MDISAITLGLAFLAGLVTTLSPCVLPILPMIASAATGKHPLGLPALAAAELASRRLFALNREGLQRAGDVGRKVMG